MFKYIHDALRYPDTAYNNDVEGTIKVQFVVDIDGSITNTEVKEGADIGYSLPEEALRVDKEKPKYYAKEVVNRMQAKGYKRFGRHQHTMHWKDINARDEAKGFGVWLGNLWFWYDSWIKEVESYCEEHKNEFL